MATRIIAVPGTHAWRGRNSRDWYSPGSDLMLYLGDLEDPITLLEPLRPYVWSTNLGGANPFGDGDLVVWIAAGVNFYQYVVPPRCPDRRVPCDQTIVISHSHGRQPVIIAAALGLQIDLFVDVCGPIRRGRYMREATAAARLNIRRWVRIHAGKKDWWQIIGQLGDFKLQTSRADPVVDLNMDAGADANHGDILRTPSYFHLVKQALTIPPIGPID